jgi:hypothetical protein
MHYLLRSATILVLLPLLSTPAWGQIKLKPAAPTQLQVNLQQSIQTNTTIPAGSQATVIVLLNPGNALMLQENQQCWIPVGGQVGGVTLPKGAMLGGKLIRAGEAKGTIQFDSLVIGTRVYALQATSAPIDGQMVIDKAAAQQAQAAANAAQQQQQNQLQTTNSMIQTTKNIANNFGGYGISSVLGNIGSLFGSAQPPQGGDAAKIAAASQKLSVSLGALQSLTVQFQNEVNLSRPTAELPSGMPASPVPASPQTYQNPYTAH